MLRRKADFDAIGRHEADLLDYGTQTLNRIDGVRLIGTASNRDAIGARVRLTAGTRTQIREVAAGSSYLGQNDIRLHFGLGPLSMAERVEIQWPSGKSETLQTVAANQILTVREGAGLVARLPLAR